MMKKTVAALTVAIMCFGMMAAAVSAEEITDNFDTVDAVVTSDEDTYEAEDELSDEDKQASAEEKLIMIEQELYADSKTKVDFTSGDYQCTNNKDGSCTIVKYTGKAANLNIPSKLNGKTVTAIGKGAFEGVMSLKTVTVPDTVKTINTYGFFCCFNLESVTLGKNVTTMKDSVFYGCKKLTSINLPSSLKEVDILIFGQCNSLTSITWPKNLTTIPYGTFTKCPKLSKVTIPSSVTVIDAEAFSECDSLKSLTIPASVKKIGQNAFGYVRDKNNKVTVNKNFTAYVTKGSAAEKYCKDNKITYKYGTAPNNGGGNGGNGGSSGTKYMKGDANGDAKVDVTDIAVIASHIKGIKALPSKGQTAANVDGDKKITVTDISMIASHIKGIKALK